MQVKRAQVLQEDRIGFARRDVDHGDVEVTAPVRNQHTGVIGHREEVAQHADHRRHAGARRDEQQWARLDRQDEIAISLFEVDEGAGLGLVNEARADGPAGDGLDGDGDQAVRAGPVGE